MDMLTDDFGLDIKNDSIMFKYNKSTYKIPSKIYPLNGRKFDVFTSSNTVEIQDEEIKKLFNMCKFINGKCYKNTEMLKQAAEHFNIEGLKYYAGWVFMGARPPMNHAWVVINDLVLDGSILKDMEYIFDDLDEETSKKSDYVRILKKQLESKQLNSDKFIFGKVNKAFMYIGCEDTYSHALELFKKALDITKNRHPSYIDDPGLNPYGKSETQRMMEDNFKHL